MNINSLSDIDFICRLSFNTLKIPFYYMDKNGALLFSYCFPSVVNPLRPDTERFLKDMGKSPAKEDLPLIITTEYMENFFAINIANNGEKLGTLISGPVIQSEISGVFIDSIVAENKLPLRTKRELENYYNRCPKKDYQTLVETIILVFFSIYQRKLDYNKLLKYNSSFREADFSIEKEVGAALSQSRQNGHFHHSHTYEKRLFQCVKEGDTESLLKLRNLMDGPTGILSKGNPIRNEKNLTICLVTTTTRAAIEAGLDSELAYTISDQYILKLEELNNIKDIEELNNSMLLDFTARVRDNKVHKVSSLVLKCRNYIFKHVYENIKLSDLARQVNMNPNYLSGVFKNQTGVNIKDYIHMQKVDEAKKLLELSETPLLEISIRLNFCNQSHFSRVFGKYAGESPKQYREKSRSQIP
ncbi:MAG: helix-turn-helix protein [Eubacterium sp.]|nr:helix-turn-helix protein [Eubacterium sp.]